MQWFYEILFSIESSFSWVFLQPMTSHFVTWIAGLSEQHKTVQSLGIYLITTHLSLTWLFLHSINFDPFPSHHFSSFLVTVFWIRERSIRALWAFPIVIPGRKVFMSSGIGSFVRLSRVTVTVTVFMLRELIVRLVWLVVILSIKMIGALLITGLLLIPAAIARKIRAAIIKAVFLDAWLCVSFCTRGMAKCNFNHF